MTLTTVSKRGRRSIFDFVAALILLAGDVSAAVSQPKMTIKDVVDRTREAREVSLSVIDFLSAGDTSEVDLRRLGIDVPDDPTLGRGTAGDIARPPAVGKLWPPDMGAGGDAKQLQVMRDENGIARASIRQQYRKWPNNEIPYALSSQYGAYSRSIIAKAMNEYHAKTCVRFVARDARKHRDYVFIHPDDGCYSLVGRVGGRQPLSLDSGCIQVGTIVHELMHAVGFFHEQSRYDRDSFIDIAWTNVVKGADDQFERYGINVIDQLNEPYDYGSIMHYGPFAFSANGRRTIVPRRAGADKMGQRVAFSDTDLRKINKLYQCGAGTAPSAPPPPPPPPPPSPPASIVAPASQLDCVDENWRCAFWSLPEIDYCNVYAEIRLRVCRRSCGACAPMSPAILVVGEGDAVVTVDNGMPDDGMQPDAPPLGAETRRRPPNENWDDCVDRSPICPRTVREDGGLGCLMPLTRRLCRRSCGGCSPPPHTVISGGSITVAAASPPLCVDFSAPRVCRNVVAARLCAMRNDCARACGLCDEP